MLHLEEDLPLQDKDFEAMREGPVHDPGDLRNTLDFLEFVGAFDSGRPEVKPYPEPFRQVD